MRWRSFLVLVSLAVAVACGRTALTSDAPLLVSDAGVTSRDAGADAGAADGGEAWWVQLHSTEAVRLGAVVVDAHDHVLIGGSSLGEVSLGTQSTGSGTLFLAKYEADGTAMWARRFGASGGRSRLTGIATNANGRIFISGHSDGPTFETGLMSYPSRGGTDAFIAALSVDGQFLWVEWLASMGDDLGGPIAIDAQGRVISAPSVDGHLNLVALSALGVPVFQRPTPRVVKRGDPSLPPASQLAFDSAGRIVVTGTTAPGGDLGDGVGAPGRFESAFVASFSRVDGIFRWAQYATSSSGDQATLEGVNSRGAWLVNDELLFTGSFAGTLQVPSPLSTTSQTSATAGYVARLNPVDGGFIGAYTLGDKTPVLGHSRDGVVTARWSGVARFPNAEVTSSGPSVVTLGGRGELSVQAAVPLVRDRSDLKMSPVSFDSSGAMVFALEAMHRDSITPTTFTTVGPADVLLVHVR